MAAFIKEKQLIPRGRICGPGSFWGFLQSVIKPKGLQIIKSKSMFLLAKAKPSVGGGGRVSSFEKISASCIIDAKMIR